MEKISAIIVDDEEAARNVLSNLINRADQSIDIMRTCASVPEAVEAINELRPDVVFLDVQMPNYAGYELVNFFEKIEFEIIFVTAFDDYAIKAFELSAIDYLVKPIERHRLKEAIDKLKERLRLKSEANEYQVLLKAMTSREVQKLIISELSGKKMIDLDSIIAIEGMRAYSKIHLKGEKPMLVSKNLKYFETNLPDSGVFMRSHKSWIINVNCLKGYQLSRGIVMLVDDVEAKVSRGKLAEFESIADPKK